MSVIRDGTTDESKWFGFVKMIVNEEAQTIFHEMNEKELDGRVIKVEKGRANKRCSQQRRTWRHQAWSCRPG